MDDPAGMLAASTFRIVGVIHLPPLPGSARGPSAREMRGILESVRRDAAVWTNGGADALIVENFGDVPFGKGAVGPETVAAMLEVETAPPEDRWRRVHLHPDLELHVREQGGRNRNYTFEKVVDLIVKQSEILIDQQLRDAD